MTWLAKDAAPYGHHHQSVKAMAAGTAPTLAEVATAAGSIPAVTVVVVPILAEVATAAGSIPAAVVLTVVAFALVPKAVAPMNSET